METPELDPTQTYELTGEQLTALRSGIASEASRAALEAFKAEIRATTLPGDLSAMTLPNELRGRSAVDSIRDPKVRNEVCRHAMDWLRAAATRNYSTLEKLYAANGSLYPEADPTVRAAFSEASNGAGNFLVPTIWYQEIMSNVERYGYARRIGNVFPMAGPTYNFGTAGAVTVSWPGNNTAVTLQDATSFFSQVVLSAKEMVAAYAVQKRFLEDSNANVVKYLATQFSRAIAKEEDLQYFNGTGTPFTGVIGTSGLITTNMGGASNSGKTAFSNISWTDMNNLKLSVNTDIQLDGAYVIPVSVYNYLLNEKDLQNRPIRNVNTAPEPLAAIGVDQAPYTYNNSPMYVVPNYLFPSSGLSTCAALFGDFRNFGILGVRQEMTTESWDQAYGGQDLSGQRQIAVSFVEIVGVAFPVASAFGKLITAGS